MRKAAEQGYVEAENQMAFFYAQCQWSLQNRPVVVTSKPATLKVDWS
jgi:hypothetical protein